MNLIKINLINLPFLTKSFCCFIIVFQFYAPFAVSSNHCLTKFDNPPCNGQPGRCVFNSVGAEKGGFVANSAFIATNVDGEVVPYIGQSAQVCDQAVVTGNAKIYDKAKVGGNAFIAGDARIFKNAVVEGNARITGKAQIFGAAKITGSATVCGEIKVSRGILGGNAFLDGDDIFDEEFEYSHAGPLSGDPLMQLTVQAIQEKNTTLLKVITNQVGFDLPNIALDSAIAKNNDLQQKLSTLYLRPNEGSAGIVRLTEASMRILLDYKYGLNSFKTPPIIADGFDVFEDYLRSLKDTRFEEFFIVKPAFGIHFQPVYVFHADGEYKIVMLDSLAKLDLMKNIKNALSGVAVEKIKIIFLKEQRQFDPGTCSCFSFEDFIALQDLGSPFEYFWEKKGAEATDMASGLNYFPVGIKDLPPSMLKLTQSLSKLKVLEGVLDKTILDPIWKEINQTKLFRRNRLEPTTNKQMNGIVYQNFRINEAIIKSHLLLESENKDIISSGFSYIHPTRGLGHLLVLNNGKIRTQFVRSIYYSSSFTFLDEKNVQKNAKINYNDKTFIVHDRYNAPLEQTRSELCFKQENGTLSIVKLTDTKSGRQTFVNIRSRACHQ